MLLLSELSMIGCFFRILLGIFCLLIAVSVARVTDTWPFTFLFLVVGAGTILSAFVNFNRQKCPECGRSFARGKEKTINHPVRFWHTQRRVTKFRPCKECCHRMDVQKKTVPRYWFESQK